MGNIALTKILFIGLIGTLVVATLFGFYSEFVVINGAEIDEPYNTALQNIGSQYGNFNNVASSSSNQSTVTNILDFGKNAITGTVNVFVVGLDAIGSFFSLIPLIGNVVTSVNTAIPAFEAILGLLLTIITVYVAMRYIEIASNKKDLP